MRGRSRPLMPLGRFVIAVFAAVAALLGAFSTTASASPRPGAALPTTSGVPSAALLADSARLGPILAADYPTSFGGLTVSATAITVYTTQPPPHLAAVVHAVVPSDTVLYARSAHTLGALNAVQRTLVRQWQPLQNDGIPVVGFGPDVATSTEQIQVVNPTPEQIATLDRLYPARLISVVSVGAAPIPSGFIQRVDAEPHAGLPAHFGWALAALGLFALAVVLGIVLHARWPRRRVARASRPTVPVLAGAAFVPIPWPVTVPRVARAPVPAVGRTTTAPVPAAV